MLDEPHDLLSELPEHDERIRDLIERDAEFRRLAEVYDALDGRIVEMERLGTPVDDYHAERLKKQRLALKDTLFARLASPAAA